MISCGIANLVAKKRSGIVYFLLSDLTIWFFYNHKENLVHGDLYCGGNHCDLSHC